MKMLTFRFELKPRKPESTKKPVCDDCHKRPVGKGSFRVIIAGVFKKLCGLCFFDQVDDIIEEKNE